MCSLKNLLTKAYLQRGAEEIFERGVDYFNSGRVRIVEKDDDHVWADVRGKHRYRVHWWVGDGQLRGKCDCPMGVAGYFCKHQVATGLVYLDHSEDVVPETPVFHWETFVRSLSHEALVNLALEIPHYGPGLVEKYRMKNLSNNPKTRKKQLKAKIDSLLALSEDIDEYDGYADNSAKQFYEELEQLETVLEETAQKDPQPVLALYEEYRRRKMTQEILPLLQKAAECFSTTLEIHEALVSELRKRKKPEEALKRAWKFFENAPTETVSFELLLKMAEPTGQQAEFQRKVLEFLEKQEAMEWKEKPCHVMFLHERRVEILLDAGEVERAWELRQGIERVESLRRRLAEAWGKDHRRTLRIITMNG